MATTLLISALETDRTDSAKVLLAFGADVHAMNYAGDRPLDVAASRGNAEAVRALLDAGAADAVLARRWAAKAAAAKKKKRDGGVPLPLWRTEAQRGHGLERRGGGGETVLWRAAHEGAAAAVVALLAAGAEADPCDDAGVTALMRACDKRETRVGCKTVKAPPSPATARLLLGAGAAATAADGEGRDVTWYARRGAVKEVRDAVAEAVRAEEAAGVGASAGAREGDAVGVRRGGMGVRGDRGRKRGRAAAVDAEEEEEEEKEASRGGRRRVRVR
jgi:hypothetical protein